MKTVLISPSRPDGLEHLVQSVPAVTLPLLGQNFISYWLEHLASQKVREVRLLVADRPQKVADLVGDGRRWGISIEVVQEIRQLDVKSARRLYKTSEEDWAPEPEDVVFIDHLPGLADRKLFSDYKNWFETLGAMLPRIASHQRVGLKEIQPGVWTGRRTQVSRSAKVTGPCFLGDCVRVDRECVVGPNAFLEDGVVLDKACEVRNSWVGPDTFVGALTHLENSLAWGNQLINWRNGSCASVPDSFLLCSLNKQKAGTPASLAPKRIVVAVQSGLSRPWEAVLAMAQKIQG